MVWDLLSYAEIKPVVNEIELHPLLSQPDMLKYLKSENIIPIAYAPIARGADTRKCPNILEHEIITTISKTHSKTAAQVMLRWGLQRDTCIIPKSNNFDR
jgi:diketogulonate reductase-like aldo/keto reductase